MAILLVLTVTSTAGAQTPSSSSAAAAFEEGRALLAQGNLAEACAKFEESEQSSPSGRTALNLGDCYERRGMIASAYAKFLDAATLAVDVHRPDAEQHARERAARLESRLPRVVFVVRKDSERPLMEVRRDGKPFAPAMWNVALPIDPGRHVFEASAGAETFARTAIAEESKTIQVELEWKRALVAVGPNAGPAASNERVPANEPAPSKGSSRRVVAITAVGVGVVGTAVGIVSGIATLSAKSNVESHCNATTKKCDDEGLDATARGRTFSVVSPVGFGVGLAGLGLGAYLLLTGKSSTSSERGVAVIPSLAPGEGTLIARGTF
jgi:hypothetical protein